MMNGRDWFNSRYPKPENTLQEANGLRLPSRRDTRSEEQKSVEDTWNRIVHPFGGLQQPKHWIAKDKDFRDWDKGASKTWGPQITVDDLPITALEWHDSRETKEVGDGHQELVIAPVQYDVTQVGEDEPDIYYTEQRKMCPVTEKPVALDVPLEEVAPHYYNLPFYRNGKRIKGRFKDIQALRETRGALNQNSKRILPIKFGYGAKQRLNSNTFHAGIYNLRGSQLTRPRRPDEHSVVNPNVVQGNELEARKYGIARIMRGRNIAVYPSSKYTGIARKEAAYN